MNRWIQYSQEQLRSFDLNWLTKDVLQSLALHMSDTLGQTITVVAGMAATAGSPASLTFTLGAGEVYQLAATDSTPFGSLPSDSTQLYQQGILASQPLTLVTSGLAPGQSQWVLIEVAFQQSDAIRAADPTGGLLYYYNSTNPAAPYQGPSNDGLTQPTVRLGGVSVRVVYGTPATTGSEAPPNADSGYVGIYLIDLAYGQTAITQSQILKAGPSVGTNVPNNYPAAPFLAGLLNSHHGGTPGQAPKINLATEVQGVLPTANLQYVRIQLTGNETFYINASTGSDNNPGTSAQPWATLQKADTFLRTIDLNGYVVTLNCSGSFTAGLSSVGPYPGGTGVHSVVFLFSGGASVNVASGHAIQVGGASGITVQGPVAISAPGAGANGIYAFNAAGIYFLGSPSFGTCGGAQIASINQGAIVTDGNYTITGGAQSHFLASTNATISLDFSRAGITISLSGTPNYSVAFAAADHLSSLISPSSLVTFSGPASGIRYSATSNAVIDTSGGGANYFPGGASGTSSSGGQYL